MPDNIDGACFHDIHLSGRLDWSTCRTLAHLACFCVVGAQHLAADRLRRFNTRPDCYSPRESWCDRVGPPLVHRCPSQCSSPTEPYVRCSVRRPASRSADCTHCNTRVENFLRAPTNESTGSSCELSGRSTHVPNVSRGILVYCITRNRLSGPDWASSYFSPPFQRRCRHWHREPPVLLRPEVTYASRYREHLPG